jgi:hypothetical protein
VLHGLRGTVGLRVRIARFFEEFALFAAHVERYVSIATQPQPFGAMFKIDIDEAFGRPALLPFAGRLIGDLEKLHNELAAERTRIAASAGHPNSTLEGVAGVLVALVLAGAVFAIVAGH